MEERYITLDIRKKSGLVQVRAENCCHDVLEFEDGLPKTTKGDKSMHGFGMKSIRFIVERYHGEMEISAKDGVFRILISFFECKKSAPTEET